MTMSVIGGKYADMGFGGGMGGGAGGVVSEERRDSWMTGP